MFNFLINASVQENIIGALSSMSLWTALAKSVLIILLGFILTKLKLLPDNTGKILTKVVMTIALPCLAFASFMSDINQATFQSCLFSFVYGFVIYIIFIFLAKLIFIGVKDKNKRDVMEILFVFGSTTFFGQPLIQAVFPDAFKDSNMFNVAYRVFLYSYAYYVICLKNNNPEIMANLNASSTDTSIKEDNKKKLDAKDFLVILKRIFINPIIIATFLGFILWSLQLVGDTSDATQWWVVSVNGSTGAFWNIKVSLPWLYQTINTLGGLSSPLVWIAIGCTLGKTSFKEAAGDKMVWIYSFLKVVIGPLINLGILFLINLIPGVNVTFNTVASTTLMWAVPPATVAITYCINSNKESGFASSASLITTLVAVIFIPIYMIILTLIQSAAIFA